jgi:uncharacterized protein (DUF1778 family)
MRRITSAIGIRVRPRERAILDRAAELTESSLSELVRRAAVACAKRIISEAEGAPVVPAA